MQAGRPSPEGGNARDAYSYGFQGRFHGGSPHPLRRFSSIPDQCLDILNGRYKIFLNSHFPQPPPTGPVKSKTSASRIGCTERDVLQRRQTGTSFNY